MHLRPGFMSWTSLFLVVVLVASPCFAQSYPPNHDVYVNDFAGILSAEETTVIRRALSDLWESRGVEATVVVIDTVSNYASRDVSFETFATGWFNAWGVGNAERGDGVLLLVAVEDRELRIALGAGYARSEDAHMARIIESVIVPRFRQNDYGGGIAEGAEALARHFDRAPAEQRRDSLAPPRQERAREVQPRPWDRLKSLPATLWALLLGGLGLGAALLKFMLRRRKCAACEAEMVKLGEVAEVQHLDQGQKLEETLGSVDWRVWECPRCRALEIYSRRRWSSSFQDCPECELRTVSKSTRILKRPTEWSTGRQEVTLTCRGCDFERNHVRALARLERDDDDSSNGWGWSRSSRSSFGSSTRSRGGRSRSFGGGRSSGGGASGKW